ncbi:TrmH family RNA methyltransferase [bacterium]|nr:MAG: TrmH family RNA methyltransferase [bacterium]
MLAILHNIRSLNNVGSVFRTADAAGVEKIFLCGITPAPFDRLGNPRPQLAKVSLGAENFINWEKSRSAVRLIRELKKQGYTILALEQAKGSMAYYNYGLSLRGAKRQSNLHQKRLLRPARNDIVLVVGNEVRGLPPGILSLADRTLEIPMRGGKESLNVAVAFGIAVFHLIYGSKKGIM